MSHYPKKNVRPPLLSQETPAGRGHDITWDRPVFRPPLLILPNLRAIFDPLPFTVHRLPAAPRQNSKR